MTLVVILVLVVLLFISGAPLFAVIGAAAMVSFALAGIDGSVVIVELYRIASNPTLVAIPLFTLAGYILTESKAPSRVIAVARSLFGWLPGGIAVVSLVSCAVFTALTGASGVTIVALGSLLFPALLAERYPERFSLGLITTSGSLGLLFPPSLPLILYAIIAKTDINALFAAGLIPGLLLICALAGFSVFKGIRQQIPKTPFRLSGVLTAVREAWWELLLPVIILAGIYGGTFTATESAVVAVVYVFIVEVLIRRDLSLTRDMPRVMKDCMVVVGAILMIIGSAMGLTNYLVDEEVPMKLFELVKSFLSEPTLFLLTLNLFLLVVGMMMDIFSAIIVVVPLILPIANSYGIDPVHLGIIFLLNLEIGYLTPPVGLNLFLSSMRFNKPILTVVRATLPFIGILLIVLAVITYVPGLSLWLAQLLAVH